MNPLAVFAAGLLLGIIITLLVVFAFKVSADAIDGIESKFNAADAERLAFLDDNLLDSVYNKGTNSWGIVTQQRRFLSSGPTLHEAVSSAQVVLAATVPFKG